MLSFWGRLLFIFIGLFSFSVPASEILKYSGHPNYPPYMWLHNNTLIGIGPKLIEVICKELKIKATPQAIKSWNRVQKMAKHGELDILVGAYKNAKRQRYMLYSIPYLQDLTYVFVKKDSKFIFKSKESLIGKKGIAMYGESYGEQLDSFIKDKLHIKRAYNAKALFQNLRLGSADYILWGYYPWLFNAKKIGALTWCQKSCKPIVEEGMYITISKSSQFKSYLPQINKIITRLKNDGTIKKWTEKYTEKYYSVLKKDCK